MICPVCSLNYPDRQCPRCGWKPGHCPNCGFILINDECFSCGFKLLKIENVFTQKEGNMLKLKLVSDDREKKKEINFLSFEDLAERVFIFYYGGCPNFITPHILEYDYKQNGNEFLFIELSEGKGIYHERLYGVTVLKGRLEEDKLYLERELDKTKCFKSISEAKSYIRSL